MKLSKWLENLTLFASGTDREVLSQCSSGEKTKYSQLGALTYIPVATSTVALLFLSSYYTRNPLVVAAVCLGWGLVVFLIERSIIASLRPGDFSVSVVARIVLAVAMSAIITEPLMVFAFREDIEEVVHKRQMAELSEAGAVWDGRIAGLRDELAVRKAALDAKEQAYLDEIDGRNGTGIHGYGPSARAKEEAYNQERLEYEEARSRLEAEIAGARASRAASVSAVADVQRLGLLQSVTTLYEMAGENPTVLRILIVLHIYFILVELLPLMTKRNYKGTQYYKILDLNDRLQFAAVESTQDARHELLAMACSLDLTTRRLEMEKLKVSREMDAAAEKALLKARSLVGTYVSMSDVEGGALSKLPAAALAELKRGLDAILEEYIREINAIITTP